MLEIMKKCSFLQEHVIQARGFLGNFIIIFNSDPMQQVATQDPVVKTEELPKAPDAQKIKSRRLLKSLREKDSKFKFYGWDLIENYAYITYLTNFRHIFDSHTERKRIKVFRHLSKLIKTRNPHQIKSHHQKMMLRHKTVDDIVEFLKAKITKEINNKPTLIPVIERINTEAEIFFIKELGNMNAKAYRQSQRNRNQEKTPKSSSEEGEPIVKAEQDEVSYIVPQVKKEGGPVPVPNVPELKAQQPSNGGWYRSN